MININRSVAAREGGAQPDRSLRFGKLPLQDEDSPGRPGNMMTKLVSLFNCHAGSWQFSLSLLILGNLVSKGALYSACTSKRRSIYVRTLYIGISVIHIVYMICMTLSKYPGETSSLGFPRLLGLLEPAL